MQAHEPPRFLLDENVSPEIASGVVRRNNAVDILYVGGPRAPDKGTLDPVILLFCERERRTFVTNNRKSMPAHLTDFAAQGQHHWGIFKIREGATIGELIEELLLLWGGSEAMEHRDLMRWIPL